MSEPAANERPKITKAPISGLAQTAVNTHVSEEGRGPAAKAPDPEVPAKDTAPQRADASEKGQEPAAKTPDPDVPAKDAAPQQADASDKGQGPAGKTPDPDADNDRVAELMPLLRRAMDSDERPVALIRNLSERRHRLLRESARDIARAESEDEKALEHFTKNSVGFLASLATMLRESHSGAALRRAREIQADTVAEYWDRFVREINQNYQAQLDASKQRVHADLDRLADRFSEQVAAIFDNTLRGLPVPSARQRIFREKWLLAGALFLGMGMGVLF